MRIAIIINPVAGFHGGLERARRRAEVAVRLLTGHGAEPEVLLTERVGHARELAAGAVDRGAAVVCAWGGDGTVNEVASALAFGPAALGIVPGGSGNGLARALKLPSNAEAALERLVTGDRRRIDAGEIDGRRFVNVAGVGFDAHVAAAFARQRGPRGLTGYAAIVLRELFRYRAGSYRIATAAGVQDRDAFLLTVANGPQWGNGALIAPDARLDDGRLDLVVVSPRSPAAMAFRVPQLFTGSIARIPGVSLTPIEWASIEADRPLAYHVDGEPAVGSNRLAVRILAGALRVCC